MAITLYPVKIEAIDDEMKELEFTLEAVDECCATIEIKTPICLGGKLEEMFQAIRDGLSMMKLEGNE